MSIETITFATDAGSATIGRTREDAGRLARTAVVDALSHRFQSDLLEDGDDADQDADEASGITEREVLAQRVRPPMDADFRDDFLPAPDIEALAIWLMGEFPELSHLIGIRISYLWKRKGGTSQSVRTLGKAKALTGENLYYSKRDFQIWLAADHVRDAALDQEQMTALLYHQLLHIGQVVDENENSPTYGETTIKIVGHDFDGFWSELNRFGPWSIELRTTANTVEQLQLTLDEEES